MPLSDIVNISITRGTATVSRAGFGTPLFMGLGRISTLAYEEYTSAQALITAGYLTTDPEYLAALALFSQEIAPPKFTVGRRLVNVSTLGVNTVANSTAYTVTINGTAFTYTSDADATATEIVTGLKAAIDGGAEPVTTGIISGDEFTITSDVLGARDTITITSNLTLEHTPANSLTVDLGLIRDVNDAWYALMAHTHVKADILELAGVIETLTKMYGYSSSDADLLTTATTDVGSTLEGLSYARTWGIYDPDADTGYPEAAWFGDMLPRDPGSATWKFKTLVGQDADLLTTTQLSNVLGKNVNVYQEVAGVDITMNGTVAEGEWIDVIRGIDWLQSRMSERVYSRLVNTAKIPYTNQGVAVITTEVRAQLNEGIEVDFIADNPAPVVTAPRVADIDVADRAARILPDVEFEATLAGAIHAATITGTVTP